MAPKLSMIFVVKGENLPSSLPTTRITKITSTTIIAMITKVVAVSMTYL